MKFLIALAIFLPATAAFGTVIKPLSATSTTAGDHNYSSIHQFSDDIRLHN